MTLEDWNTLLQFASAVLLGLTFAVGAGAIFTGYLVGKRQEERIAATEHGTAEANKRAAEAGEGTAKALAQVAEANARAAEANRIAEEERLARVKLEERLAWRRVSAKEYSGFVTALKPFHGSSVQVMKLGEAEAGQFADDILKVFADSGWHVQLQTIGVLVPPRYGLQCSVNDASPAGRVLAAILKSLPTANVEIDRHLPVIASILVALRPTP